MNNFFQNKTNIFLSIMLVIILGAAGFLAYGYFSPESIKAIDYSQLTKGEIEEWFSEKEMIDALNVEYEYSDDVALDKVIYQSIKEGDEITDKITIVLSKGMDLEKEVEFIEIDEDLDVDEALKWLKDNGFNDVSVEYALSKDYPKGIVLKANVSGLVKRSMPIILTVSAGEDTDSVIVEVPNFKNMTKNEVSAWASANAIGVKFAYEMSASIAKDKVISQSIEAGKTIKASETLTVTISQGKGVTMISFSGKNKSYVSDWCRTSDISVSFTEEYSDTIDSGYVVSQSISSGKVVPAGTSLKVVISKGAQEKVDVPASGILGISEAEFLKKAADWGLNPVKSSTSYFSTTLKAGTIYSYDDGLIPVGSDINYALSCGSFNFDKNEFNGKKKSTVESLVKDYNARNAHLTISFTEVPNNSETLNRTYGCEINGTAIACKIAIEETVELANYVGNNSPCNGADACEVGGINFSITSQYSDNYAAGIVISQDVPAGSVKPGTSVKLVVSLGPKPVETSYIMDISDYESFQKSDADSTIAALKSGPFAKFTNVSCQKSPSRYGVGVIISISVGGDSSYSPGNYAINTPIVITVCSEQTN